MRRGPVRALAAAAVLLAATSCVSLPEGSSVKQADGVGVAEQDPPFTSVAAGPTPGADTTSIVEGFYKAMLAYPRDLDTAREFLTTDAAAGWDPDAGLTVYDDAEVLSAGDTMTTVNATVAGTLDRRGTWTSASPDQAGVSTSLKLKQVDGEWRITNPADGMFLDSDSFNRYYQRFSLYFFDPSLTVLTPDPVYLGVGDAVATSLVSDLLKGPTGDLKTAVRSAVPDDTTLDVAVSVSSTGEAEVPLSSNVLKLSAGDRQLFAAQLAWTLRQIDDIRQISISVDGNELDIENTTSPFDADAFSGFDPAGLADERRLFAMLDVQEGPGDPVSPDDGLNSVNAAQVSPVLGAIHTQVPAGESVAVQTSGQLAAIVRPGGGSIAVGSVPSLPDDGVATWFTGTDILRPSWDALDVLWVVDQGGSRIYTVTATGSRPVPAKGFDGLVIHAFAVSRDGVRFAAIVTRDGKPELVVSTISRDPDDPTSARMLPPRTIASSDVNLVRLADLAWVSPTSLAVLAAERGDDLQPFEVAIDGSLTEAMGGFLPKNLTSIAAGPSPDLPVAIGTKKGLVYIQTSDSQWLPLSANGRLTAPAYPG